VANTAVGKMDFAAPRMPPRLYSVCLSSFDWIFMSVNLLFDVSENDPHKLQKEASVKFLSYIAAGNPKGGLDLFSPDCKTHNPYTAGGMEELTDAMIAVQRQDSQGIIKVSAADFKLKIQNVIAEGDLVAVYTRLSSSQPSAGGLRQVHLFRFGGYKIVEYWDITQFIPENAPNADAALS
jgi:predicted SnoaL-like aldol condensation-catalyzing enzyme